MILIKREDRFDLYNDPGHKIASTNSKSGLKLSLKNCEAIVRGYDLDELAETFAKKHSIYPTAQDDTEYGFKAGFQAAVEILGDKRFSEKDILKVILIASSTPDSLIGGTLKQKTLPQVIETIKQKKWEVVLEMEFVGECKGDNNNGCFQESPAHNCGCFKKEMKLDEGGCLILKSK
jgi:hypothetical protein